MNLSSLIKLPEFFILIVSLGLGMLFFSLTDPQGLPPAMLVAGFIIIAAALYSGIRLLVKGLGLHGRLSSIQRNGLELGVTMVAIVLLALQSIGQLSLRDTITLVVLYLLGYFYVSRTAADK